MATIDLDRIEAIQQEIEEINRLNILDVAITRNGQPVEVSEELRQEMRSTGLSTFALLKWVKP